MNDQAAGPAADAVEWMAGLLDVGPDEFALLQDLATTSALYEQGKLSSTQEREFRQRIAEPRVRELYRRLAKALNA